MAPSGVLGLPSSPSLECSHGFLHSQPSRGHHPQEPHCQAGTCHTRTLGSLPEHATLPRTQPRSWRGPSRLLGTAAPAPKPTPPSSQPCLPSLSAFWFYPLPSSALPKSLHPHGLGRGRAGARPTVTRSSPSHLIGSLAFRRPQGHRYNVPRGPSGCLGPVPLLRVGQTSAFWKVPSADA